MLNLRTCIDLIFLNLKRIVSFFLFGTIIGSIFTICKAQEPDIETTPKTQELLQRFEQRFAILDSIVFKKQESDFYPNDFDSVFFEFAKEERVSAIDAETKAKVSEMKNKTGLAFRGQAYVRPGAGVSYDPDDPLVSYNAKLQAEINWNIFNSSVYKRGSKRKAIEIQGELEQLNYVKSDLDEQIIEQRQILRNKYYGRLLYVINIHNENVKLLMETQIYLLEHGKISGDDLLRLINQQTELERQLISIKADSVVTELPAPVTIAYIIKTDTAGIFRSIKENNIELKKLDLRHELLKTQKHLTDYVQTMDILPFVRYSYYNRPYVDNTYNLDAGFSFVIPISGEVAKKRKVYTAGEAVLDYEQKILEGETTKGIYLTFHDLEIYNENILGEYQRMNALREFLDMRKNSYSNVDGEYSRLNRLEEYNAYLQAWERLLEYTYRRDMILLDLQRYLLRDPLSNYIQFKEYN